MNLIGSLFIDHKLPPFDPLAHIKRKGDHIWNLKHYQNNVNINIQSIAK